MKKNLLCLVLICCWFTAFSQNEYHKWYFGNGAGLDFSSGQPVFMPGSVMNAPEGCASISDAAGNLQFYTHGETIWTKNHTVMQNGQYMQGNRNVAQSAIIIPKPNTPDRYYLFTNDPTIRALVTGLKFSEIDMTQQGGLGNINSQNLGIWPTTTGHLTAVRHNNNRDVWVLAVDQNYINFRAYLVSPSGVSYNAILSQVGFAITSPGSVNACMKFSPDGTRLAINVGLHGTLVYQFNANTGRLTNPMLIPAAVTNKPTYGVEFSANNKFLFVSNGAQVQAYNLWAGSLAAILASGKTMCSDPAFSLQLAPDGNVYAALSGNRIGCIENNGTSASAGTYKTISLPAASGKGLPQYLRSQPVPLFIQNTGACSSDSMSFTINNLINIDSVVWQFGDPGSGQADVSRRYQPKHLFTAPGTYTVTAKVYAKGVMQTLTKDVTVPIMPRVEIIPRDTLYCDDTNVRLQNAYPPNTGADSYEWYFNNVKLVHQTIWLIASNTGWYKLKVNSGTCSVVDSVYLRFQKKPEVKFGGVTRVCAEEFKPTLLDATWPGATYKWHDGSTNPVYTASQAGKYSVVVTAGPCITIASTEVIFSKPVSFDLGPAEIEVCERSYTLTSRFSGTTWSTGEKGKEIVVTESGMYSATVTGSNCPVSDSIKITFLWCITQSDIPNIISPNGDDQNEKFFIKNLEPKVWSLDVYNRWGNQVYQKETYDNSWAAEGISDGVYYYLMQNRRSGQVVKGWVEVVR